MGLECMQIFPGSPRRYETFSLSEKEESDFQNLLKKGEIYPIYFHASYLLNLASEDERIRKKSLKSLRDSLHLAYRLQLKGVIYHPGSPKGGIKKDAIEREARSIKEILQETPQDTALVVENTAGVKKIGTDPKEVGYILEKVNSSRLKVCLDTAHSLESGNISSFSIEETEAWFSEWEKEVGAKNIALLHVNDSRTEAGSQHDRHENIGYGHIKREGFVNLMKNPKGKEVPWILEVPGFDGKGPDKENVDVLKKIREEVN